MRFRKSKHNSNPEHAAMSVIDHGCEMEGRLTFVGTLIVNGKFSGELISSNTLIVSESGELEADVRAGTAILAGQFSGHITVRERVELRKSARVVGDIVTPVLIMEEGVFFEGNCNVKGKEPQVIPLKSGEPQALHKKA